MAITGQQRLPKIVQGSKTHLALCTVWGESPQEGHWGHPGAASPLPAQTLRGGTRSDGRVRSPTG